MLVPSGGIRGKELGPLVLLRDLTQTFPYNDAVYRLTVTGAQLKRMVGYLFRPEALEGAHTEFYQFSSGMRVVVSLSEKRMTEISFEGKPIEDDRLFRIGLQSYHYKNMQEFFGISEEEVAANARIRVVATNATDVLDENLSRMELVKCPADLRWITLP